MLHIPIIEPSAILLIYQVHFFNKGTNFIINTKKATQKTYIFSVYLKINFNCT